MRMAVLVVALAVAIDAFTAVNLTASGSTIANDLLTDTWNRQFYLATYKQVIMRYTDAESGPVGLEVFMNGSASFGVFDKSQSAPLQEANFTETVVHIPVTIAGLTITYNLAKTNITGKLNLTADILARIYQQNITTWDHPAIKALNPNLFYHGDIFPVRRADASGTTFVLTEYLAIASPLWRLGTSVLPAWPPGILIGIGNTVLLEVVSAALGSIGYVDFGTAHATGLPRANLQNRAGNWVQPSTETIMNAADTGALGLPAGNGSWTDVSMVDEPGADSWPLVTFVYIVVRQDLSNMGAAGAAIVAFLNWTMTNAAQNATGQYSFAPLPSSVLQLNQNSIACIAYDTTYQPSMFTTADVIDTGNTPGVWAAIGILSGLGIAFWIGWEIFAPKPHGHGHGHGGGGGGGGDGKAILSGGHKV